MSIQLFLASANTYRAANPNVLDVASRGHCNFTGTVFFLHYLSKNDSSIEIIKKQYFFCQIVAMNQKVIVLATLSSELSMTSLMDSPSPKTRAKRVGK